MDRVFIAFFATLATIVVAVGLMVSVSSCQTSGDAGNSKFVEYSHKLKNGKSVTCLVLIEDKAGSKGDEPSGIDCDWGNAQ